MSQDDLDTRRERRLSRLRRWGLVSDDDISRVTDLMANPYAGLVVLVLAVAAGIVLVLTILSQFGII